MKASVVSQLVFLLCFLGLAILISCTKGDENASSERMKVAMRDIGNNLLLADRDSTSLVMPVEQLDRLTYQLSFETSLAIYPDSLVSIVEKRFEKSELAESYLVEVHQCKSKKVAYSYEMSLFEENTIIPCSGRNLPSDCYTISVRLNQVSNENHLSSKLVYATILGASIVVAFFVFRREPSEENEVAESNHKTIGIFKFYPNQHKLVKHSDEIGLSKKECELLEILIEHPNQIVTRDELSKRVWEDNGVFVGRSLDTYISKLRKKLIADERVRITNVHGVGYKLEIDSL